MEWVRKISLVRRVKIGFAGMLGSVVVVGGYAVWVLHGQGAELDRMIGAATQGSAPAGLLPSRR